MAEYLGHAAECREMFRKAAGEHKRQLENMAETWKQLAEARRAKLRKLGMSDEDDVDGV